MRSIVVSLQGRFGNQCLTYLFCRALAERIGCDLRVEPWVGERIFQIDHGRPSEITGTRHRLNVIEALQWAALPYDSKTDVEVRDYCQRQEAVIYTKRQAQAWLTFRPEIIEACLRIQYAPLIGHQRTGDYRDLGYVVVRRDSYWDACQEYGLDSSQLRVLNEENAEFPASLAVDLSFVADFWRMVQARTLLRGNSTFSWLAGLLGKGLVLSPVIEGLEGGKEHHCRFVAGNHPRFANLSFTTDLYVNP